VLKVVLFGAPGPCLEALLARQYEVLLIRPPRRLRARLRRTFRPPDPVEQVARSAGVRLVRYSTHERIGRVVQDFTADVVCIATFPFRIPAPIRQAARLAAINIHPSLLPRYRGPDPYFWAYFNGDADTAWTAHVATDRIDGGPILAQERIAIPRGHPVTALGRSMVAESGAILLRGIDAVLSGHAGIEQDEARASRAPRVDFARLELPLGEWPVAQAWHFLAGYRELFRPRLNDDRGHAVEYDEVPQYDLEVRGTPGLVVREAGGWRLCCHGGSVHLRTRRTERA